MITALTFFFPLIGFFLLAFSKGQYSEKLIACIGVGTVGVSLLVTVYTGVIFFQQGCHENLITLGRWIIINDFRVSFSLLLDKLSFTMLMMITTVGFLIHVFSVWYMKNKKENFLFFAYTNLFMVGMIVLVLANNLLFMYLGWEGVGVCSYLLIGFYRESSSNGCAAMKAFIMTRIGDICLILAILIIYHLTGTLEFREIQNNISYSSSNQLLQVAMLMMLFGAISKSAQIPLHTWLADAMSGPTPASALIHAATMVTSGVYIISRNYSLFLITPYMLLIIAIIGLATAIIAGLFALAQTDIKRILAYSTMSQLGYMFLALGLTTWQVAIYHLIVHAFFKALLFLSAGSLINSCDHEQNIFKIREKRNQHSYLIYICFLIGGASLSGVPLITLGFFSKKEILMSIEAYGNTSFLILAMVGVFITSLYTFRMIFTMFHGKKKYYSISYLGEDIFHNFPLLVLVMLSTFIGKFILDKVFYWLSDNSYTLTRLEKISSIVSISGILLAKFLWPKEPSFFSRIKYSSVLRKLQKLLYHALGLDMLYKKLFVNSFLMVTNLIKKDPLGNVLGKIGDFFSYLGQFLLLSENGYLRWYTTVMGMAVTFFLILLLVLIN